MCLFELVRHDTIQVLHFPQNFDEVRVKQLLSAVLLRETIHGSPADSSIFPPSSKRLHIFSLQYRLPTQRL